MSGKKLALFQGLSQILPPVEEFILDKFGQWRMEDENKECEKFCRAWIGRPVSCAEVKYERDGREPEDLERASPCKGEIIEEDLEAGTRAEIFEKYLNLAYSPVSLLPEPYKEAVSFVASERYLREYLEEKDELKSVRDEIHKKNLEEMKEKYSSDGLGEGLDPKKTYTRAKEKESELRDFLERETEKLRKRDELEIDPIEEESRLKTRLDSILYDEELEHVSELAMYAKEKNAS